MLSYINQKREDIKMSKIKVAIIEDDEITSMNLKLSLQKQEYEVVSVCDNTQEALKEIEKNPPDIAIIDISLQDSDDGIILASEIKKKYNIPFIYLTSHCSDDIIAKAKQTKPYGYIVKPFHPNSLHASIQMALFQFKEDRNTTSNESLNHSTAETLITFAQSYKFDNSSNSLSNYDSPIELKESEKAFFKILLSKRGVVVTFEEVLEYIQESTQEVIRLKPMVLRLRAKLPTKIIEDAPGIGYFIKA
jgi:DNA-binding response OmpR family regulator